MPETSNNQANDTPPAGSSAVARTASSKADKAVDKKAAKESKKASKQAAKKDKKKPVRIGSPRWVAPAMLIAFGVGLLWIVAWYIAPTAPLLGTLGAWNVVIGFVLIAIGFVISTKWK